MISLILFVGTAFAAGNPMDTIELHKLVANSEQQVKTAQELLKNAKSDTQSLEKAAKVLEQLSTGINKSIQSFEGTPAYEKALIAVQNEQNTAAQAKLKDVKDPVDKVERERTQQFQTQSVQASQGDMQTQEKLQQALQTAEPGFVPKLQAQAQIGSWQTNTRVSTQLTQVLAELATLREDMKNERQKSGGMAELLNGMDKQNQKLKEVTNYGAP